MERQAVQEFTWLSGAGPAGFTLAGTGVATVTTPPVYEPGSVYEATMSAIDGDAVAAVVAGTDGSLTLSVPLGIVPPPVIMGVPPSPTPGSTTTVTIAAA